MHIIALPKAFDIGLDSSVQLYDYKTSIDQVRNQVNLTTHAFSFLLEGQKEVLTEHQPISINNKSFLMMKSGHCLMTEYTDASNTPFRSLLLFFTDADLDHFLKKYQVDFSTQALRSSVQVVEYDAFISSFVKGLLDINGLENHVKGRLLQVKFEEIMLYLLETKGSEYFTFLTQRKDEQELNFIRVVESNTLNKLTLKELAFLSNMSISTFKRAFERHYKTSPIKWFQDKRLEHAAFLLSHKTARPSEVFEDCGYDSLSNFIQAFKKKYGLTPKQYQLQDQV